MMANLSYGDIVSAVSSIASIISFIFAIVFYLKPRKEDEHRYLSKLFFLMFLAATTVFLIILNHEKEREKNDEVMAPPDQVCDKLAADPDDIEPRNAKPRGVPKNEIVNPSFIAGICQQAINIASSADATESHNIATLELGHICETNPHQVSQLKRDVARFHHQRARALEIMAQQHVAVTDFVTEYIIAAKMGYAPAQTWYGEWLFSHHQRDDGVACFMSAAEKSRRALYWIGDLTLTGFHTERTKIRKDEHQGNEIICRAAKVGDERANQRFDSKQCSAS